MNDEQKQNDIIISAVELTNWGLKIKDEKGLIYNISQYKKDTDQETVAYQTISKLPKNGMGLKKTFKFVEVPNSQGGTSRYVRMILDIQGQTNTLDKGEQMTRQAIVKDQTKKSEDKWTEISWGKCKYGFLIELIKGGMGLEQAEPIAEKWADASMRKIKKENIWPAALEGNEPETDYIDPETGLPF